MPSKFKFPGVKGKSLDTSPLGLYMRLRKKSLLQHKKDMLDALLFGLGPKPSVVRPRGGGKLNYSPMNIQPQQTPFMAAMDATSGTTGDPDFAFFDWKKDPDYYEDDEVVLIDLTEYIRSEP